MDTPEQTRFKKSFVHEDPANPRLARLLSDYKLAEVTAPGKTELDKMRLLSAWVFDRIPRFGRPTLQTEEALTILENAHNNLFYCAHYAVVYAAAALALGWEARVISQRRPDFPGRLSNHNVVEAWSRQFNRWIFIDPTHDYIFLKDGIPLNCYEIGREWFKNEGRGLVIRQGREGKEYTVNDLPLTFREFHYKDGLVQINRKGMTGFACHAWVPTNRFLDPEERRSIERWDDWEDIVVINGLENDWNDKWEELTPYYSI